MKSFLGCLLLSWMVVACASGQPAPAQSSEKAPAAAPAPAPAELPKATVESQREPFMQGCMGKAHSPDYCECAFLQFGEVFKDADLSAKLEPSDPRLKTMQEKTIALCASKLNEDEVKTNFMTGCSGDDAKKQNYCACAWKSLRKELSIVDFLGDGTTPRFVAAKKTMVVACKGKLPVDVTKKDFMTGCTEGSADREASCTCLWKKIKAKFSSEEIAADVIDVDSVPGLSDCNK